MLLIALANKKRYYKKLKEEVPVWLIMMKKSSEWKNWYMMYIDTTEMGENVRYSTKNSSVGIFFH